MHRKKLGKQARSTAKGRVSDIHAPDFTAECRRQSRIANQADSADPELEQLMEEALDELLLVSDPELSR